MPLWILFYALIGTAVLCGLVDHYLLQPRRDRATFGDAWKKHNDGAFHPLTLRKAGQGLPAIERRVAIEMSSTGGKRAVRVRSKSGLAVHEVRRDGAFSSRGPYYTRRRNSVWSSSGSFHLIDVEVGYFPTSNPQGGDVRERGLRVVEWDTSRYPPMSLRDYATRNRKLRRLLQDASDHGPDLEGAGIDAHTYERWAARLKEPFGRYAWIPAVLSMLAIGIAGERSENAGRPVSWVTLVFFSIVPGFPLGGFAGSILLHGAAARVLSFTDPRGRLIWASMRAEKKRTAAEKELRSLGIATRA